MAGTSYTRQSTLTDGDTITAALFNDEYNKLVSAFAYTTTGTTGHRHDGTTAEGGNIHTIGDQDFLNKIVADSTNNRWGVYVQVSGSAVEQIRIQDGAIVPVTDSDIDLGTSSLEFKDGFFDGTIHVDTLDVDANATVAGTLAVTGNTTVGGTLTVTGTTAFNGGTLTLGDSASDNVVFGADINSDIIPNTDSAFDLGSSSQEWRDLYLDGTAHIDTLDVDVNATVAGTLGVTGVATVGGLTIGSAVITEAELETIDTITAGTVAASKAVVVDANKDITGFRNVTLTGEIDAATGDFSGAVDIDGALDVAGTTNLDVVDIDGAVDMATTLAVAGNVDFNGDLDVDGTTNLDVVDIDGATQIDATVSVGVDDTGYDVKFFGATSGKSLLWDESADSLIVTGTTTMTGNSTVSGTLGVTGVLTGTSLDISGDIDVDGTTNLDVVDIDGAVDMASSLTVGSGLTVTNGSSLFNRTHSTTTASLQVLNLKATSSGDMANGFGPSIVFGAADTGTTSNQVAEINVVRAGSDTAFNLELQTADATRMTIGNGGVDVSGVLTANAGITVDTINIDGGTIATTSGNFFIDSAADIYLDADGGNVFLRDDGTNFGNFNHNGNNLKISSTILNGDIVFAGNDGGSTIEALTLDMSASGRATFNNNVVVTDNNSLIAGSGDDLQIFYNGTNGEIDVSSGNLTLDVAGDIILDAGGADIHFKDDGTTFAEFDFDTPNFRIKNPVSDGDILLQGVDGGSSINALTLDMSEAGKATFSNGLIANGDISLGDSKYLLLGNANDFQIFHNGADSYLFDNGTGNLNLTTNGASINLKKHSGGENMLVAVPDGSVSLYHNNSKKIETTSSGVTVTGTVAATSYTGSGANLTGIVAGRTYGTTATTTSGTSFTFTGIPAGVYEVNLLLNQVKISGGYGMFLRLGTSSGIVSSGYQNQGAQLMYSGSNAALPNVASDFDTGFSGQNDGQNIFGYMKLTRSTENSNTWIYNAHFTGRYLSSTNYTANLTGLAGGIITLGGELTQIQIIRERDGKTFTNGSATITWSQ